MKGVEEITDAKIRIAIIIRNDVKVDGIKFFTEEKNPFQLGIHQRKKGISLAPHSHFLAHNLIIDTIQEILFIQKGKIKLTLYNKKSRIIASKILNSGDTVLLMDGAHGVKFLEDSRIFEVKQGPYPGSQFAKIYIK